MHDKPKPLDRYFGSFGWMNTFRSVATLAIITHHWLLFLDNQSNPPIVSTLVTHLQSITGTSVHLFFLLSGCGLTVSYLRKPHSDWLGWYKKRFVKIVVPYWIVIVIVFALSKLSVSVFADTTGNDFSLADLVSYLGFYRNHYPPGWELNPTLWFMPPLVGLYVVFPALAYLIRRLPIWTFFFGTLAVNILSILVLELSGYDVDHQTSIFVFFLAEFTLGMVIAYFCVKNPYALTKVVGLRFLALGVVIYAVSFAIVMTSESGENYNDFLTCTAWFFMMLTLGFYLDKLAKGRLDVYIDRIGRESYVMYLLHGPLILFFVEPFLVERGLMPISSYLAVVTCVVFWVVMYSLSVAYAKSFGRLTN